MSQEQEESRPGPEEERVDSFKQALGRMHDDPAEAARVGMMLKDVGAEPLYLTVKGNEISVYYDATEPRNALAWEQIVFGLLDKWKIPHDDAGWLITEDWPPLEARQLMTIDFTEVEGTTIDAARQQELRNALNCQCSAGAYASYAYSELFGRRNGLGIEFTLDGKIQGRLDDLTGVLDYWIQQNDPLIFGVQLRPQDNPAQEAERVANELGIFLYELPEEL